nr:helix-turn-helix domain-containing protein [Kineococcus siccus]
MRAAASAATSADGSEPRKPDVEQAGWQGTVTTGQAAEQLGCSARRVRQLLEAGRLRGHREAGRWVVTVGDLQEFANRRTAA